MFPQRLKEEERRIWAFEFVIPYLSELVLAGKKKNAVVLSNRPSPSLRNDLPSKTTWHGRSSSVEVHLTVRV